MPTAPARLLAIAFAALLLLAACSDDDDDSSPTATATDAGGTATATITTPPTSTAEATPTLEPGISVEVGPFALTNIRFDPPRGELPPRQAIRITAEVVSTFDRELRLYFSPIDDDGRGIGCPGSDGNQLIAPGNNSYDRRIRPVDVPPLCPLENVVVEIAGFEVSAFDLDDESVLFSASIPASFTVNPELAYLVDIDGERYRVLFACRGNPTVGLSTENLLLQAESPIAEHPLVSFQLWLDEGTSGYVVQLGTRGEVLRGLAAALDGGSIAGVAFGEGAVSAEGAGSAEGSSGIEVRHAHQRPEAPCQEVVHHLDSETELNEFVGRWAYGVLEACAVPDSDGADLWLTDGGRLRVSSPSGQRMAASFVGFDGVGLAIGDGESMLESALEFVSADLSVAPVDDASAASQRLRFEVTYAEAPCRSE